MKNSIRISKKVLALVMAILMCLSAFNVAVFAADTCTVTGGAHTTATITIKPTCVDRGYDLTYCTECKEEISRTNYVAANGHTWVSTGNFVEPTCTKEGGDEQECSVCKDTQLINKVNPLGHSFGEWTYEVHPDDASAYAKIRRCTRDGCETKESVYVNENVQDIQKYYQVKFINKFATDEFFFKTRDFALCTDECSRDFPYCTNHKFTDRYAKTWKTQEDVIYVKDGEDAVYPYEAAPLREKDLDCGDYRFTGWVNIADSDDVTNADGYNPIKGITENVTLEANFDALNIYHTVTLFDYDGAVLQNAATVRHGDALVVGVNTDKLGEARAMKEAALPVMGPTYFTYEFKEWSYDVDKIYVSNGIQAIYTPIPIDYTVNYYDADGNKLATEQLSYGEKMNVPTSLVKAEDAQYIYSYSGEWVRETTGEHIDENKFTIPVDAKVGDEINVYAELYKRAKKYDVNITATNYKGEKMANAVVTVLDKNGNIYLTSTLDSQGNGTIKVGYGLDFTLIIVSANRKYAYKDQLVVWGSSPDDSNYDPANPFTANVNAELLDNDEYNDGLDDCDCICHTFIGSRLWIPLLNLLYRLTGIKHMCCYDMYAVHGDLIIYGSDS